MSGVESEKERLLVEALDMGDHERAAFVDKATAGNSELRDELEGLLVSYEKASSFFEKLGATLGLNQGPNMHSTTKDSDPAERLGRQVGQYQITDHIGTGGMGVVYKAEDTRLGRTAALKFLPASLGQDQSARQRFLQEARAASTLDHPNICTIYEIGEADDGHAYIAMPYYAGETLADRIRRGPIGIQRAVDIAIQIASGLEAAHARGIVHRDVKPANILITEDGVAKILDFGLAKSEKNVLVTREGATLGTAAYMSPEQAIGQAVDHRTDVWSLGVVLYEMLSGARPFPGAYPQAVIYGILNTDPEPIGAVVQGMPLQFSAVLERALDKRTDLRYPGMSAFVEDLVNVKSRRNAQAEARVLVSADGSASTNVEPASDLDDGVLHILCVDDEPELELLMQQRFRKKIRAGTWKFVFALDGADALEKLEANPQIGLILTDLNMPRMDGLSLLSRLADLDRPLRTIVVSAYSDLEKIRTAMNRGAFDFVTKPIDFKDLDITVLKAADDLALYRKARLAQRQMVSIQQEMDVARRIQEAILPGSLPEIDGAEIYGFSAAAAEVSGTFYDAFKLEDGRIGLMLGDADGKGVAAALLMAMAQTFVRSFLTQGSSPASALDQLNRMPFAEGLPNRGLQILAGVYDPKTGFLTTANAGIPCLLVRSASGSVAPSSKPQELVWADATSYTEESCVLKPGDALLMGSQGLAHARNPGGVSFSSERVASIVREADDSRPTGLIRNVVRAVYDHAADAELAEDVTLLALKRE